MRRPSWLMLSVDRGTGSERHLCDGNGTPLKVVITAAVVNDAAQTPAWSTASSLWPASPADRGVGPTP